MARHRRRDYSAEYARRKQLATERGLSLSQARGHPRTGEAGVRALKQTGAVARAPSMTMVKYYRVVGRLAKGESLARASRAEGASPSSVRRLNAERELYQPVYRYSPTSGKPTTVRGYQVEYRARMPILTSDGALVMGVPLDRINASLVGRYWNATERALRGDDAALQGFSHATIYDTDGNSYRLLTDINAIRRWRDSLSDADLADFDRTFYGGREVIYAPAA